MDETTLLVIAGILLLAVLIIRLAGIRANMASSVFSAQLQKRNGRIQRFSLQISFLFQLEDEKVRVQFQSRTWTSQSRTMLLCRLKYPVSGFHVYVIPTNRFAELADYIKHRNIQVMNPAFNDSFMTGGEDENQVLVYLDNGAQEALLEFAKDSPMLMITNNHFQYSISGEISDPARMDNFIESGIVLLRRYFRCINHMPGKPLL